MCWSAFNECRMDGNKEEDEEEIKTFCKLFFFHWAILIFVCIMYTWINVTIRKKEKKQERKTKQEIVLIASWFDFKVLLPIWLGLESQLIYLKEKWYKRELWMSFFFFWFSFSHSVSFSVFVVWSTDLTGNLWRQETIQKFASYGMRIAKKKNFQIIENEKGQRKKKRITDDEPYSVLII